MEMYNEELADNTAMVRNTNVTSEPPSLEQHPEISRLRKLLLILIGTNLVLCIINFLFVIHSYAASESLESQSPNSSSQLASVIISLIFYGFGLLVVYRYYQTGLLVFALLGLVSLILMGAIIIVFLIRIIHMATDKGFVAAGIIVAIIFVAVSVLVSIIQIFIVLYAFKLYALLKTNKRLTIEQI